MAVQRKVVDKNLLMNVIRHTDAHNKIQEEIEMWKQYDLSHGGKSKGNERSYSKEFGIKETKRIYGHMRCDDEEEDSSSCYWTQQLYNFEANDSERWGHSGYKELYPEEFTNDANKNKSGKSKKKRRKRESREDAKQKKRKKERERKRRKNQGLSDSESGSSSWESRYSEANKRRKRKHGSTCRTLDGKKRATSEEYIEKNGLQLYKKPKITVKGFQKRRKKDEIEIRRDKELVVKNDIDRTNQSKKRHKRRKKEDEHYDIELDKQEFEWVEKVP